MPRIAEAADAKPNVLFIAIDDLRSGLSAQETMDSATPHLDRLAESGRAFTRHFTQVPTCGASRCALWRGRYPEHRAHLGNGAILRTHREWEGQSLPEVLRQHGYRTLALGKITHYPGGRTGKLWQEGPEELPGAWDRCWIPDTPWGAAQNMMHGYAHGRPRVPGQSPPWESAEGPDAAYPDAWIADEAIATLRQLNRSTEPWFFAVGFFKPHLPFGSPRSWWEKTDPDTLAKAEVPEKPAGISSWHGSGEFRGNYGHDGKDPAKDSAYERLMRHGYASAARYMDAQVGRVLQTLDELDPNRKTIVVAWSDHGFLLGEHAIWGKHCLYEMALRSPLIIRAPAVRRPGVPSRQIVETVDLVPTLLELCGAKALADLSGTSLLPQLADPDAQRQRPALGFWGNQRTIRTERWRLIVHESEEESRRGLELFDLQEDPFESKNVAAQNPEVVQSLTTALQKYPRPRERTR